MYINSYGQVVSDNYLAHHGILGQKWGQRNGPPYPLDANAHSAAEKRLKGKNEGELDSWKAKKTAKIDKTYGSKINKLDKKIAKTTRSGKLERLKSKKADMIFKSSMKKAKIAQTTEKQYRTRKRIKTALKVTGAIAVAALAFYVLNRTVGRNVALNRYLSTQARYEKAVIPSHDLRDGIIKIKGGKFRDGMIKQLNALSDEVVFSHRGYKKAESMLDIYKNGSLFQKAITQLKGF